MEYLTVEEISEQFDVPVSTVRRWCADGTLQAGKHGRQWLVERDNMPATPPRRRARRATSSSPSSRYDLVRALQHLTSTDLREVWVPDVADFRDLSRDDKILSRVAQRLADGRFDPPVEVPIPKTPFFTRSAVLLSLEDRVAYQAVVGSFASKIEARTCQTVYSARLPSKPRKYFFAKKGTTAWLEWGKAVRLEVLQSGEWLIKTDLTAYFDTVSHDLLISEVMSLNVPGPTIGLLRAMFRSWALVPGQGIPQGPNASRLLGNLFMLPVDRAMTDAGYRYYRYLDDVRIVTARKAEAITAMRLFERECRLRGLLVSSSKTELLHGERAIADVSDDEGRGLAQYFMDTDQLPKARKELRRILRGALGEDGHIDVRSTRFAVWRLTLLRESSVLALVLAHLEDLAPVASAAMAYLRPFLTRKSVVRGLTEFLNDDERASSPFMLSWVFALTLDHPGPLPPEWVVAARRVARDRNWPPYVRVIAANVLARGYEPTDLTWMQHELLREFDPSLLRGYAVALARSGVLDKNNIKALLVKEPDLASLVDFLSGRKALPSLLFRDKWNPISR